MKLIDPSKIAEQISREIDHSIPDQVGDVIEMWLLSGTVRGGDRFPSVRDLSVALEISHKTARRCQEELRARGLIAVEGNRTYCANIEPRDRAARRKRFESQATTSILALRESGCSLEKARAMVERAWNLERGPYAAV